MPDGMTLTSNQLHILQHSLGCDKYGRSTSRFPSDKPFYRNRYVCDPNPTMDALVTADLLRDHGPQSAYGGMHFYSVTPAGIRAMTEKELTLKRYELDVRVQEAKVRDAKMELERGHEKMKAEFERDYARLKSVYEREVIQLERDKAYLEKAKADMVAGFET